MDTFSYVIQSTSSSCSALALTHPDRTEEAYLFHASMPEYKPTPLVCLPHLAKRLGVGEVWVKDESARFGLNAFKALGGSYAIARALCDRLGIPMDQNSCSRLRREETKETMGTLTFVTATDGNHGRGVAWAAKCFGHKAVVYMPKGSSAERLKNIQALGAEAAILPYNYDDCVRYAERIAKEKGWLLVQDTAWAGYEEIPTHIMQGYTTMAWEISQQMPEPPTHLFLQAGVGSMAGAICGYFAAKYGEKRPCTLIVEPDKADCLFRTAQAGDGELHFVTGDMDSIMAGLCCGEPCSISWEILKCCADAFVSCGDDYAARGMRLLGRPEPGDRLVVSGESGAVTAGVLEAIMQEQRLAELRCALKLNETSRVLLISTEGDTDKEMYRKILGI